MESYASRGFDSEGLVQTLLFVALWLCAKIFCLRLKLAVHQRGEEAFVRGAEGGEGDTAHTIAILN